MRCPNCDEGIVEKILFKGSKTRALFCDLCGSLWFTGHPVRCFNSRPVRCYTKGEDREFTFDTPAEKNPDMTPVVTSKYK